MVKAVADEMNSKLWSMFPTPSLQQDYSVFVDREYYIRYISVFDRWLSKESAAEDIVLYQEDFGDDVESQKKYQHYESLLLNFYSSLYDNTKVYERMMSCRGDTFYVEFDSKEEYLSHILLSIREQLFVEIVLPEYKTMICGGYDFTLKTMVRKSYSQGIAPELTNIIKTSDLYILD